MKKITLMLVTALGVGLCIVACDKPAQTDAASQSTQIVSAKLAAVLAAQPDDVKARYAARHPHETLEFFGLQPGMSVVEALPGDGWYTKILLPFIGAKGEVIGADYAPDMYPKFGLFDEKFIEGKKDWVETWTAEAEQWRTEDSAYIAAFQFGSMTEMMYESTDVVLFIRALHNLARFEKEGGYLTTALNDAYNVLKPGGIVGVVQHMAPEESSDEWASGANGYLKKSFVIAQMEKAGFKFVASSDINVNPLDQPGAEDFVWRLPPTLATSKDNPELKAKYEAIGESTRMTLKFIKPLSAEK